MPLLRFLGLTCVLLLALVFTACDGGGGGMNDPDDRVRTVNDITVDGGTLNSPDGRLTLVIPPGALGGTESISIEERPAADLGTEFSGVIEAFDVQNAYELGPEGLTFQQPVSVQFTSEQTPVQADSLVAAAELLFTSTDGTVELLDSLQVSSDADANTVVVQGQMTHFSPLLHARSEVQVRFRGVPDEHPVGGEFFAHVLVAPGVFRLDPPPGYFDFSMSPVQVQDQDLADGGLVRLQLTQNATFTRFFSYACTAEGTGTFVGHVLIGFADAESNDEVGVSGRSVLVPFQKPMQCVGSTTEPTVAIESFEAEAEDDLQVEANWRLRYQAPDGTDLKCFVDWDDGSGEEEVDCGTMSDDDPEVRVGRAEHTYETGGSYTLGLRATYPAFDDVSDATQAEVTVEEGSLPSIVDFSPELRGPTSVLFQVEVDYAGPPSTLSGQIDYDDGTVRDVDYGTPDGTRYTAEWTYEYDVADAYMPALTVTGTGGSEEASFELEEKTLTVQLAGDGMGTVVGGVGIFPFINCEPTCEQAALFAPGAPLGINSVFLTAEPESQSVFGGWSGDTAGGEGCGPNDECGLRMDQDRVVTATFAVDDETDGALETGLVVMAFMNSPDAFMVLASRAFAESSRLSRTTARSASVGTTEASFGPVTGEFPTAIAGADGFVVLDLATGEVLLDRTGFPNSGPFFGVVGASQDPPGTDTPAMFLGFGQNGLLFDRFDRFGALELSGTTFDATTAGGGVISNMLTETRPNDGVEFYVYDPNQNLYVPAATAYEFDDSLFDGELVSAYMHDDRGNLIPQGAVLVVTRGPEGGLYLATRSPNEAARVADLNADARKIRCTEISTGRLVCAISVFDEDRLQLLTWNGETAPTLGASVDVGDGPVGIDLRPLSTGNVAVVSTGFNDDTVTETVVNPNAAVVFRSTRSAPDGCTSPGHAVYVEDAVSLKVVGTCFASDAYFIVESSLEP